MTVKQKESILSLINVENLFKAFITVLGTVVLVYWNYYTDNQQKFIEQQQKFNEKVWESCERNKQEIGITKRDFSEHVKYHDYTKKRVTIDYTR